MKVSYWGYLLLFLGIFGIILINLFGNLTTSNEQDYHLLKEITEASMIDAIDLNAAREGIGYDGVTEETAPEYMHCVENSKNSPRIIREKFVESFVRRFSAVAKTNDNYVLSFDDIDECPPKVSVTVTTQESISLFKKLFGTSSQVSSDGKTVSNYETDTADVVNKLTAILEAKKD